MADSINSTPEGVEQQKINQSDFSFLKAQSKKFARNKLTGNNDGKKVSDVNFYNNFSKSKYSKENFLENFESSLSSDDQKIFSKMTDDEKNKLYELFSGEANKLGFIFERKRHDFLDSIEQDYEISTANKKKLTDLIDGLTQEEIEELIISQSKTEKFLKSKMGEKVKNKDKTIKNKVNEVLSKFNYNTSEELVEQITKALEISGSSETIDDALQSLIHIQLKVQSGQAIEVYDMEDLFSYGIFSNEQKELFIKAFIKTISLQELVDLGIISRNNAENQKTQELMSFLVSKGWRTSGYVDSNDLELIELINRTSLSDIEVKTKDYLEGGNLSKLITSQTLKERLTQVTNETIEEVKEEYISKILNAEVFKEKLLANEKTRKKIVGGKTSVNNFENGSMIKITSKVSKDSKETFDGFIEVKSLGTDGSFKMIDRTGDNKCNMSKDLKSSSKTYIELFESLESNDLITGVEFLTPNDLRKQIDSGAIKETTNELSESTKEDKENFKSYIDEELARERVGKVEDNTRNQVRIDELEEMSRKVLEGNYETDDVKNELTYFVLKSRINELDKDGEKYGFEPGVTFSIGGKLSSDDNEIDEKKTFTITKIDKINGKIDVISHMFSDNQGKGISFDAFFDVIKDKKCKRVSNSTDLLKMVENLSIDDKVGELWKNFEFKDGQIQKKSTDHAIAYTYLAETKKSGGTEVLRLGNVIGSGPNAMIEIFTGDIEEVEKGEGKEKVKNEIFNISDTPTKITIGTLENYIKSKKLEPRSEKEGEDKEKEAEIKDVKPKWGFAKWLFSNKSISEIMKGLKMGLENFEHHLKEGNEEHAAKVALATWGKFMPMEIRMELQARVEQTEKKHMDEYVSRLEAMDSWQAVMLIDKRLSYKNTEEYKKEAGLVFMMKKYGNLYNKAPLNAQKGTFLWFRALSGYRGDVTKHPLYQEVKLECETPDSEGKTRNFTEEELVWKLMKKQCGSHGYGGIHRMSRLHKEIEKYKKSGIKEEIEDGFKKGDDTRNPKDQMIKGIDEIHAGSPANAVGRFKKLVDRGDDMATMNSIPFILVFSGVASTLPDDLSNIVKGIVEEGRYIPLARFMSYPKDIKVATKAIKILAEKIQDRSPYFPDIGNDAREIYEDLITGRISEKNRIKKVDDFYKKKGKNGKTYGEVLTKAMYMLADGDDGDDLNSLLLIEKDKPGEDGKVLSDFFGGITGYIGTTPIKEEYFSDSFQKRGLSSIGPKVLGETLQQQSGGGYMKKDSGPAMVGEIKKEIEAIKRRTYKNEDDRKIWLKYYIKNIFSGLVGMHQSREQAMNDMFKAKGDLKFFKDKRGITTENIQFNAREIENPQPGSKCDKMLDQFVNNILNDEGGISNVSNNIDNILRPQNNAPITTIKTPRNDDED